jgi:hypothetical protein
MVSFKKAKAAAQSKKETPAPAAQTPAPAAQTPAPAVTVVEEPIEVVTTELQAQPTQVEVAPSPVVKQPAPIATFEANAISTQLATSGMDGDWGHEDLQLPRLSLVQGSGQLIKEFDYGTFVYNKAIQLNSNPEDSMMVIFLNARKYYQENVDFDSGEMGKTFETLDDARASGFMEGYSEEGTVSPICDLTVLLALPDGHEGEFEHEGVQFVRALWSVKSGAYSTVAKKLASACILGHLKGRKTWEGAWELSVFEKSKGKNSWNVPTISSLGLVADHADLGENFTNFLRNEVI